MPIMTSAEYPMVRAALDVSLDATALPDATIALDLYAGAAVRDVLARDPAAGGYSAGSDQAKNATLAAVYFCAALLAAAIPDMTSESLGEYRYSRQARDWAALAGELRGRAEAAVNAATGASVTVDAPTFFAVGPGRRGA